MFELNLKLRAEEARRQFSNAFNTMQAEMTPVRKRGRNKHTGSFFAKAEDVMAMLDPLLNKNGFSRSTSTEESPQEDMIRFVLILRHVGGHEERHFLDAPYDHLGMEGRASKTKLHGMASSYTFCERHLLIKVCGATLVDDDDGNAGAGVGPSAERITESQTADLEALITEVGSTVPEFLKVAQIRRLEDLPVSRFRGAVRMLEHKRRAGQ